MAFKPLLDADRREAIRAAFDAWYNSFDKAGRGAAAARVGIATDRCSHVCHGRNTPTPTAMKALYQETGNNVFQMTEAEKEKYRRNGRAGPVPNNEGWPDLPPRETKVEVKPPLERPPEEDGPMELDSLIEAVNITAEQVRRFGQLPPTDPRRQAARKRLAPAGMKLFHDLTELQLEFPDAFRDLLDQLEVAGIIKN